MLSNCYFEYVKTEFRKNDSISKLPTRSTKGSAGYDFESPVDFVVPANGFSPLIFTDIKAHIDNQYVLMLFVRSSVGIKKGCVLANGTGIIDESFFENPDNDGNIGFKLFNCTDTDQTFKMGERIFQGVFLPYSITINDNCDVERTGGIGSTGK